jgi:hypothetical protein
MRWKVLTGLVLAAAAAAAVPWLAPMFSAAPDRAPSAKAPSPGESPQNADSRFAALPERPALGQPGGPLFSAPPPPPAPKKAAPAPVVEAKPTPPPMPYRVAGTLTQGGVRKVVLAKGDKLITVEPGETLDGGYRVETVGRDEVTLVYTPLDARERLAIASAANTVVPSSAPAAAGGSRAAQLRWDGPARVQAGNIFEVTLRVTAHEALRSSPLQITYDSQHLEPVAVRQGKFFGADASFNYRINPTGTIFVGATGAGSAATDADLLVLSFKPLKPAPAAEVKIAALTLQGAVGKPVAVEPVSAYRTAITP